MRIKLIDAETDQAEWTGELAEFLKVNEYTEEDGAAIRRELDAEQMARIGGGAAPAFYLVPEGAF